MTHMKFKLSKLNLVLYINFLTLFPAQLIPFKVRLPFIALSLIIVFLYIFSKMRPKEFFNVAFYCLLGIFLLSIINYRNGNISFRDLLQCFIYYFSLALFYDVLILFHKKGQDKEMLKSILKILVVYTILNIISTAIIGVDDSHNLMYLFGNKFRVSYYIIYIIGLVYCLYNYKIKTNIVSKTAFFAASIVAMVYMYYITCKTGLVAIGFILIISILLKHQYKFIENTFFILACLIATGFIILGIGSILELPIVQNFIHLLNEDIFLTGRTRIYSTYLFPLLSGSKYIGYGYGNTVMWSYSSAFENAQNGMFDFILDNGTIGLVIYYLLIFIVLKGSKPSTEKYGLYLTLFAMIIVSTVEVNYGAFMLVIIFLIKWYEPRAPKAADKLVEI